MSRPTGTIVFLFSDIEGSTARWDAQPRAMQSALRRHDDIVRLAMESHAGHVFKTLGDAFCVSFHTARDALEAALDAQRALVGQDWSAVSGLRVRMAIHAGEADERSDDYFGPALNRVARLLSTAQGGQVVLSGAVTELLGSDLPDGTSVRPLGTFRLKDLQQPERVYQLVADGLPADFKPLRTLEALPNNLPLQSTGFIGRESDIANIRSLLHESTLVTITGPGGVGKTRVALQSAVDALDQPRDGLWFINLAALTDPDLVTPTIMTAVGASAAGECDELQSLVGYLEGRELLLILDNCEHVVAEVARVVSAMRERCPHVTVLATSREVLHLDGERIYRLPPLEPADSVQLFVQRALAAAPAFQLTQAHLRSIEEICRHLDGIPLAVELAAARVRVLSPDEISRRLSERFRILTGGNRSALPRQQTLRALIDWSFELLTEEEKTLFRRVSVFSGTFTLEAASAISSDEALDEWTIIDLLSSLVDKSLVVANVDERQQRFHLLETIQQYARRKLQETDAHSAAQAQRFTMFGAIRKYAQNRLHEAGETLWLRERHALFFAERAAAAYTEFDAHPPQDWSMRLLPDLDNYRAALHWTLEEARDVELGARLAGDIGPMFMRLSLLSEGVAWCRRAMLGDVELQPQVRARLEYVLSMLHNNQAAYADAFAAAQRAHDFYEGTTDERGAIRALSQLAQQYARAGSFDKAKPFNAQAIERARAAGDPGLLASVLRRCAFALPPEEIELARAQFDDAVVILRSLHDHDQACLVLQWWAEAEAAAECFDRAIALASGALECADRDSRMYLTSNIAGYTLALGDFARAEPYIREALELAVNAHHPLLTAIAFAYCAAIRSAEDASEAARLFGYARARMSALNWDGIRSDQLARENILRALSDRVPAQRLPELFADGAAWGEEQARAHALPPSPLAATPRSAR